MLRVLMTMFLILINCSCGIFCYFYNQMESTLVMAAKNNSDLLMFGFKVNAASYQMVNPILIYLVVCF